jgi:1,4-dihydroxy-2-naphthoate octaprenyltransferase
MSARGTAVLTASAAAATAAAALLIASITASLSFLPYVAAATFIAFAYSMPPLHLKARAMGDLPVFVAFGPLPSAFVWHVTTATAPPPLLLALAVPFGFWAVAVLHCNNMRDADHDARIGRTLAILLGPRRSRVAFRCFLMLSVLSGSFAMMYSSLGRPSAFSLAAASAAGILALAGMRLTSNILAKEAVAQPQDVAAAAGAWGVCYLATVYAVGVTCVV